MRACVPTPCERPRRHLRGAKSTGTARAQRSGPSPLRDEVGDELLVREAPTAVPVGLPQLLGGVAHVPREAAAHEDVLDLGDAGLPLVVQLEVLEISEEVRVLGHTHVAAPLLLLEEVHALVLPVHPVAKKIADIVHHLADAKAETAARGLVVLVCVPEHLGDLLPPTPLLFEGVGVAVPLGKEDHLNAHEEVHDSLRSLLLVDPVLLHAPERWQQLAVRQLRQDLLLPERDDDDEFDAEKLADWPDLVHPSLRVLALAEILKQDKEVPEGPEVGGDLDELDPLEVLLHVVLV
mmetsp:Transcript_103283/g.308543  ORF Transcript_103283/g.308543 Transcript_103283/m.308543 type:complete len:293 (+) Transcript_103283:90-968(+)